MAEVVAMMRKGLAILAIYVGVGTGVVLGIFAVGGFLVAVWGLDMPFLRGGPPDRSFWVGFILLTPATLIGAAGSLTLFYWPLISFFPWLITVMERDQPSPFLMRLLGWERKLATRWVMRIDSQIERMKGKPGPDSDELSGPFGDLR